MANRSNLAFEPPRQVHGLENKSGENNCFLNATIQALWHVGPFRVQLKQLLTALASDGALLANREKDSILAALCNLFVRYEFAEEEILPPTELRESLGNFSEKFQVGQIADANEALDAILQRIHLEQRGICPEQMKCLSHATFGGMVLEQIFCKECGASSEPSVRNNFLMYFQAVEIISEGKASNPPLPLINLSNVPPSHRSPRQGDASSSSPFLSPPSSSSSSSSSSPLPFSLFSIKRPAVKEPPSSSASIDSLRKSIRFGTLLRSCMMSLGDKSCPSKESDRPVARPCTGKGRVYFFSLEPPLALALSLSWDASRQSVHDLHVLYSMISDRLYLHDVFSNDIHPSGSFDTSALFPVDSASSPLSLLATSCGEVPPAPSGRGGPSYAFRGLVCFYGQHYVSFFHVLAAQCVGRVPPPGPAAAAPAADGFYLFDDQTVRPVGQWPDVVRLCLASVFQPVLLLYELEHSGAGRATDRAADRGTDRGTDALDTVRDVYTRHWGAAHRPGDRPGDDHKGPDCQMKTQKARPDPSPIPRPAQLYLPQSASANVSTTSSATPSGTTSDTPLTQGGTSPRRRKQSFADEAMEAETDEEVRKEVAASRRPAGRPTSVNFPRYDKTGQPRHWTTSSTTPSSTTSNTTSNTTSATSSSPKTTMSATDRFQQATLVDRPFDPLDEEVDAVRRRWNLPSLKPAQPPARPLDIDSLLPVQAPAKIRPSPQISHDLHPPWKDGGIAAAAAAAAPAHTAGVPGTHRPPPGGDFQFSPIVTHWSRRFRHYSVHVPVCVHPGTGERTAGLALALDDGHADRLATVSGFLAPPGAPGHFLLPPAVREAVQVHDHVVCVNNVHVHDMSLAELRSTVQALALDTHTLAVHLQSRHPLLYAHCRGCGQATAVAPAVEKQLIEQTRNGTRKLLKAIRIPCEHCQAVNLAIDYEP